MEGACAKWELGNEQQGEEKTGERREEREERREKTEERPAEAARNPGRRAPEGDQLFSTPYRRGHGFLGVFYVGAEGGEREKREERRLRRDAQRPPEVPKGRRQRGTHPFVHRTSMGRDLWAFVCRGGGRREYSSMGRRSRSVGGRRRVVAQQQESIISREEGAAAREEGGEQKEE